MKRNFTKLMAALALLVFTMPSLVAWGQTKDEVVAYTLQPATGSNNNYASNCDITIDGITWNLTGNSTIIPWRIGGKSLSGVDRALYSKTAISDDISKIEVTHGAASSITVNSWTVIVASDADFTNVVSTLTPTFAANATTTINRPDGTDWSNCYYKFVYNVTVSGSSNKFLEFSQAKFYKETGTTLQDSDLSLSPTALSFDLYDDAESKTITISTSSTGAISVSNNAYVTTQVNGVASITVTPVAVTPETQTITVSQAADNTYNAGEATFTVSIANTTPQYSVTYKANGGTGDDIVDTYFQGDDVTIRPNTFVYTGHAFTNWNTLANGTGTAYQPAATIENIQANVELYAQWEESNEVVDVLTAEWTGVTGTTYTAWADKSVNNGSEAVYAGNTNINNGGIGLRTKNSDEGIITTASGGFVRKVVVTWTSTTANRTLDVYGKDTPYEAVTDLFDTEAQGTLLGSIVYGTSTEVTISGDYAYVGLRSHSDALGVGPILITWEPDSNPAVSTTTTINVPSGFNTDIHQGTNAGTLTATVTAEGNTISGATVTWSSSDETVATINANGAVTLVAVGTTTITANYAGVDGEYRPSSGTYELTVTDSNAPGTQNNPYTVAQARAAIDAGIGTQGVYATGIVCTASNNLYSGKYLSYYISDDGTETDRLEAYNGLGLNGANFTSVNDVQVGATVVIYGNLTKYNQTYEFAADNYLVSYTAPVITDPFITVTPSTITATVEGGNGTLSVTYENITEIDAEVYFCNAQGSTATYDWISASINSENNVAYTISANDGAARMAYLKVKVGETFSNLVTITQTAYMAPFEGGAYTLASSIESGKTYIIVGLDGEDVYAMGVQNQNNRGAVDISVDGTTAIVNAGIAAYEFVIESAGDNVYSIHDARTPGYLYAASSSSNYLKTETTLDDNGKWTIVIEDGEATITAQGSNNRNEMRFNPNTSNNNPLFACYASTSTTGSLPRLYVKVPSINITGYGATSNTGGYYLIASPVNNVNPANVTGMTTGDFDLYEYDDTQDKEWLNWKGDQELGYEGHFNLVSGKGYLYAKSENVILAFTGTPYSGNGQVPVVVGWNLIGNPFGNEATLNAPFYRMNEGGAELSAEIESGSAVNAMEGVFVNATEAGNVTFSTASNKSAFVAMNVTRNRGTSIDRAIVRFDEGQQLPKFQLFENSTKLYIPQGNNEFAVVRSAAEGEMPVNFRAAENGTYTINVDVENMEMDYLHLIDNMTGADVDLLATPSYTFEARTNDYTSRFRLVFSANGFDEQTAETFAFFNGTSWTVSNLGEATLQVIDVTGRIVKNETISGNASISINEAPGVYMMRLVSGNDVKVQKVVVR